MVKAKNIVGPVYTFFEQAHGVPFSALGVNYRSNEHTIVEFARQAGYQATLQAHSPNLRVDLALPTANHSVRRTGRPHSIGRRSGAGHAGIRPGAAGRLLRVRRRAKQPAERVRGEGGHRASVAALRPDRRTNPRRKRRDYGVSAPAQHTTPYTPQAFWESAVGVVTPHRAQHQSASSAASSRRSVRPGRSPT